METLPYSELRQHLRVGDVIGCQGGGFISRVIRKLKGGEWSWSHVSMIITDVTKVGRVEVLEALFKEGMTRNYLSKSYERDHGKLFWLKMGCSEAQRTEIIELGAQIIAMKVKYDYRVILAAVFAPMLIDAAKFCCSEAAWYLLTAVGKLKRRFDKKYRQIAPVPGDFPTWSGVEPIEIDMSS
jgi:hypothetical protein